MLKRTAAGAALAVAAMLVLTGCSGPTNGQNNHENMPGMGASQSAEVPANQADIMFAAMMIPHHEQAIEMADVLLAKDGIDPQVTALAERIKAAQGPEIDLMQQWLDEWGVDEMPESMDHGGMMGDGDMDALEQASGAEAERLFLEGMIVHHEGAIEMAEDELADGENQDALDLANDIIEAQSTEIAEMQGMLK